MANFAKELRELEDALRVRFRLPPGEPSDDQLAAIVSDLADLGRMISDSDWEAAVRRHCPGFGSYKYGGLDFSDLNALLMAMIRQARS